MPEHHQTPSPSQEIVLTPEKLPCCRFAGVEVLDVDPGQALGLLTTEAQSGRGRAIHLCNAYTLNLAARTPGYAQVLSHRALNLPDGVPVSWFSRLQTGQRARGPVRGPSLMRDALAADGLRHFFLGGSDEVLESLTAAARAERADIAIVGSVAPAYGPVTEDDLDLFTKAILDTGANVVWVGLGTPKQDEVIAALVDRVPAVLVGVGAAFDFLSGAKKEAPRFLHGSGLEWLYRMASEPGRLWKRYLIGNSQFLWYAGRELRRSRRGAALR